MTSAAFHNGEVALSYPSVTLGAAGGAPPYMWSIGAGSFPPGLTLSQDGVVTGTPTSAGKFNFNASVADTAGGTVSKAVSVSVFKAMAASQPCAGQCVIGAGCSTCGGFGAVTAGAGGYTYQVVSGHVPSGMTLGYLLLKGAFPKGSYSLVVDVSDQLGAKVTIHANWAIYGPATLNAGSDCSNTGIGGVPCSTTGWSYAGGNPSAAPKVVILGYSQYCVSFCRPTPSSPPLGWSISVKGGVITFRAGPIACNSPGYAGYLTLALVDTSACATTLQSNQARLLVNIFNGC